MLDHDALALLTLGLDARLAPQPSDARFGYSKAVEWR